MAALTGEFCLGCGIAVVVALMRGLRGTRQNHRNFCRCHALHGLCVSSCIAALLFVWQGSIQNFQPQ
jgi:K+-transporting ATPase A subunit